jgi:hypothetical protein
MRTLPVALPQALPDIAGAEAAWGSALRAFIHTWKPSVGAAVLLEAGILRVMVSSTRLCTSARKAWKHSSMAAALKWSVVMRASASSDRNCESREGD